MNENNQNENMISKDEIREVAEIVDRVKTALRMNDSYFLASLTEQPKIIASVLPEYAMSTKESVIGINPKTYTDLEFSQQAFILCHEVLHIANLHPERMSKLDYPGLANYAFDAVLNHQISSMISQPDIGVRLENIWKDLEENDVDVNFSKEDMEQMSDIELYKFLKDELDPDSKKENGQQNGNSSQSGNQSENKSGNSGNDTFNNSDDKLKNDVKPDKKDDVENDEDLNKNGDGDKEGEEGNGEKIDGKTIQKGQMDENLTEEERKKEWEKNIADAINEQKTAGSVPSGLQRYVEDLLEPGLDAKSLIQQHMKQGIGSHEDVTWARKSRKHHKFMGRKKYHPPTVWAMVDTSGSVSKDELALFLGTIQKFSSMVDVKIVPWDAKSYEIIEAKKHRGVTQNIKENMKGGGGTKVAPALEKTLKNMSNGDITAILTDGGFFDLDKSKTQSLLKKVENKSAESFICVTQPGLENTNGWPVIEM